MILPENQYERDYAYAVAAMGLRARAQDVAGDTEGAIVLSQARRDLEARGAHLHGARNAGLVEFATVLANQEDKPQTFLDFMGKQDAILTAARDAKRAADAVLPPDPVVIDDGKQPEPVDEPKPVRRRRTKKED